MFIDIDGLKIHYHQAGKGKPIVLLHGWGTSLDLFEAMENYLLPNFQVISLDFPGFGKSDEPDEPWDVERYVQFLETF